MGKNWPFKLLVPRTNEKLLFRLVIPDQYSTNWTTVAHPKCIPIAGMFCAGYIIGDVLLDDPERVEIQPCSFCRRHDYETNKEPIEIAPRGARNDFL